MADIIKKYSNFVGFPIKVNGDRTNTIRALWTVPKDKITDEEHKEFYQFISRAYDTPAYRFQYSTDSPINIRALVR
jgi:TNF receptor-associated protein 1